MSKYEKWHSLTPREQEVGQLIALGESNKTIAFALGISQRTVESHRSRLFFKLGVRNSTHLVWDMLSHSGKLPS
ncbi:hypothetical protein IX83_02810 [Basilea psittacipulmonis DSM 24701]|uniref:HTH luxR-type domain-containing protein n=1 Tax=Basilea psittacipulmonis DSM 24701 TaxID=1072685 RepID=A0A077DCQ9_9BURK|nr:hypothetical protein IX83_02810 [Basilea psittacipulmonis DSM 24701]